MSVNSPQKTNLSCRFEQIFYELVKIKLTKENSKKKRNKICVHKSRIIRSNNRNMINSIERRRKFTIFSL